MFICKYNQREMKVLLSSIKAFKGISFRQRSASTFDFTLQFCWYVFVKRIGSTVIHNSPLHMIVRKYSSYVEHQFLQGLWYSALVLFADWIFYRTSYTVSRAFLQRPECCRAASSIRNRWWFILSKAAIYNGAKLDKTLDELWSFIHLQHVNII